MQDGIVVCRARLPEMTIASSPSRREPLIDFYRSCFMLFVFYHHTTLSFPGSWDLFAKFNPFAELFVGISGFVVAYVFLHREDHGRLLRRAMQILAAYYVVAVPVSVGAASVGDVQSSPLLAVWRAVALQEDRTGIGILRFYGLVFLTLPWLLKLYRRRPWTVLAGSAMMFLATTHLYHAGFVEDEGFFVRQVVMVLLQWQFFFVVGMGLGDLHRQRQLIAPALWPSIAAMMFLGLLLEYATDSLTLGDKFPYPFEKYLNLMWSLPLVLVVLYGVFRLVRHTRLTPWVLVVGMNSLLAFIISELISQCVKLVVVAFELQVPLEVRQVIGVLAGVVVIATLHAYTGFREALRRSLDSAPPPVPPVPTSPSASRRR